MGPYGCFRCDQIHGHIFNLPLSIPLFFSMAHEISELEYRFYIIKRKFIAKIILQYILGKKMVVFSPCCCEWLTWTATAQTALSVTSMDYMQAPLDSHCRVSPSCLSQISCRECSCMLQLGCSGVWPHIGHAFRLALWKKSNLKMERSHRVVHKMSCRQSLSRQTVLQQLCSSRNNFYSPREQQLRPKLPSVS